MCSVVGLRIPALVQEWTQMVIYWRHAVMVVEVTPEPRWTWMRTSATTTGTSSMVPRLQILAKTFVGTKLGLATKECKASATVWTEPWDSPPTTTCRGGWQIMEGPWSGTTAEEDDHCWNTSPPRIRKPSGTSMFAKCYNGSNLSNFHSVIQMCHWRSCNVISTSLMWAVK